jgi:hypothetical protein
LTNLYSKSPIDTLAAARLTTNAELETLIEKENIVRLIKSRRLQWAARIIRMEHLRTVKKLTEWETCSSRSVVKPRLGWIDQAEEDLKKMKVRNWNEECKIKDCGMIS